jgi:hypothetical protein
MHPNYEMVNQEIPKARRFYSLGQELEDDSGLSRSWWKKKIDAGEVKILQPRRGQHGSKILIPRGEVVRVLAELVR